MRISDLSSDVCSSDLPVEQGEVFAADVEYDDLAPLYRHQLLASVGDVADLGYDVSRHLLCQAVGDARVVAEEHLLLRGRHREFHRIFRIVEIPVRIIGGEEDPVPADPVEDLAQMRRLLGLVERRAREPEGPLKVVRRRPPEVWKPGAHATPGPAGGMGRAGGRARE